MDYNKIKKIYKGMLLCNYVLNNPSYFEIKDTSLVKSKYYKLMKGLLSVLIEIKYKLIETKKNYNIVENVESNDFILSLNELVDLKTSNPFKFVCDSFEYIAKKNDKKDFFNITESELQDMKYIDKVFGKNVKVTTKFLYDDIVVDNILDKKKKKIKSSDKGKRGERGIVKILNKRFEKILRENPDYGAFSRSIGSGNRFGQKVILSKSASEVFASDLVCPPTFKFVVESKFGYDHIDLCYIFENGSREIDKFIEQVEKSAKIVNKEPLLIWKKGNKPSLAFINKKFDIKNQFKMYYKEYLVVSLDTLLKEDDEFFFG